ncbi:H-2 class II histocompatibility antigen, E-U alpha chain-like [Passerculus sandwichensis]
MDGARSLPRLLPLLAMTLPPILGVQVQHSIIQTEFYQKSLEPPFDSSEFMFDFDVQHSIIQTEFYQKSLEPPFDSSEFMFDFDVQHSIIQTEFYQKSLEPPFDSSEFMFDFDVQHSIIQTEFYQKSLEPPFDSSEFMFDFDGDEIFHVEREETVWRLPEFRQFASFEAQGALQNIAIDKQNLESSMRAYNNSRTESVPPEVAVFPKHPVEQDEPNVLICSVTKFWPPVLGLAWFRNGARVTEGVQETPFYPDRDFSFRKFSYLTFIPQPGDYYDCKVEHEGLAAPSKTHWGGARGDG